MFGNLTNTTKAYLFFGLAFGMTLTVSLLQPLLGEATMFLHMFTPTVAALLMLLVFTREGYTKAGWSSLGMHRAGLRWWGVALLGPLAILTVVYSVVWISGAGNPAMPDGFTPVSLLLELLASLVITTLFAIGEEIGFRGYLLSRLKHLGTTRALVLGGMMFGIWHFPLMLLTPLYPIHGSWLIVGPIVLVTLTAAGAFYGSLRLSSDSIWPATIAHGAVNSYFKMFGLITVTASPFLLEYLAGETGVLTMIATVLAAAWLIKRIDTSHNACYHPANMFTFSAVFARSTLMASSDRSSIDQQESDLPAGLAQPAQRALAAAGYVRLEQLARVSEAELKQLHGVGPKAIDQLRRALEARGMSFASPK